MALIVMLPYFQEFVLRSSMATVARDLSLTEQSSSTKLHSWSLCWFGMKTAYVEPAGLSS